jgi:hypothetical protein
MENQTQQPIQPPMPVQPAEQPMITKNLLTKWPLIIVGVILLATLLTGTYMLGKNQGVSQKPVSTTAQTTSPTPTPSYQFLKDDKAGFELKYPSYLNHTQASENLYIFKAPLTHNWEAFRILINQHANFSGYRTCNNPYQYPCINPLTSVAPPVERYSVGTMEIEDAIIESSSSATRIYQTVNQPYFQFIFTNNIVREDEILANFKLLDQTAQAITPIPTINQFASWKTYSDSNDFYSFKYPETWFLNGDNSTNVHNSVGISPMEPQGVDQAYSNIIAFNVLDNPNNLTIEDYAKANISPQPTNYSTVTVAGIEGKRTTDLPGQFNNDEIFLKYKNKIYTITLIKLPGQQILSSTFDQILSTFKFTQ